MIRLSATDRLGALPTPVRSSGTWATPCPIALADRAVGDLRRRRSDAARGTVASPVMTCASSPWPLPATAAMPTISPARTSSDTPAQRRQPAVVVGGHVADGQDDLARLDGARSMISSTSRPTIRRARSARRGVGRREPAAVTTPAAHDRDPVGDGHHLAELVADEHDAASVGGHRPERPEQLVDLLRGEDGGRLVHDQDPGAAVEELEDLDPLLLADRQLPDLGAPGRRAAR